MPRISDSDINRVKRETDLLALARARGLSLKKHGSKDWVGKCPFHGDSDDSPNLIFSPAKGLFHCMACGAAGNVIQFVQKFDGLSFRHAFELLNNGAALENPPSQPLHPATTRPQQSRHHRALRPSQHHPAAGRPRPLPPRRKAHRKSHWRIFEKMIS